MRAVTIILTNIRFISAFFLDTKFKIGQEIRPAADREHIVGLGGL